MNYSKDLKSHNMKIAFLVILLNIGYQPISNAQITGAEDSAKVEIRQLTHDWNQAIINRDSLVLEKLLDPDYSLQGSLPRNKWINNTLHHFSTEILQVEGEQIIFVFGDAALSQATFYWKAAFDGTPRIDNKYWVNDIWKKNNGSWQILMRMTKVSK